MFDDRGFYKRAQIVTGNDLALAGVAAFDDLDRLTIFADNLVPHVLRCDGVLVYEDRLAAHIDAGKRRAAWARPSARSAPARCTPASCSRAHRRRAARCSTAGCGTAGQAPEYKARPRHRTATVFY